MATHFRVSLVVFFRATSGVADTRIDDLRGAKKRLAPGTRHRTSEASGTIYRRIDRNEGEIL